MWQVKMDKVAGSQNDEFYTPRYAILPILKYLRPGSRVWCPFDTGDSLFVRELRAAGHRVAHTHLGDGVDFFQAIDQYAPHADYIVSNPPYSLKTEVLEALFAAKVPFAMLIGVVGIFESQRRFDLFAGNDFEVLYFNRRVAYFRDYADEKPALNPPFSSAYFCSGVLPKQIVFEEIDKKDAL